MIGTQGSKRKIEETGNVGKEDFDKLLLTAKALVAAFEKKSTKERNKKDRTNRYKKRELNRAANRLSPAPLGQAPENQASQLEAKPDDLSPVKSVLFDTESSARESEKEEVNDSPEQPDHTLCHDRYDPGDRSSFAVHRGDIVICGLCKDSRTKYRFCMKHMELHDLTLHSQQGCRGSSQVELTVTKQHMSKRFVCVFSVLVFRLIFLLLILFSIYYFFFSTSFFSTTF